MKSFLSKILLPAAISGLAVMQLAMRPASLREAPRHRLCIPQVQVDTTVVLPGEEPAVEENYDDSLYLFGFSDEGEKPAVQAKDTIKAPDSLLVTDPFLYEWYVAVKDSLTHRMTVDSLRASGDSLIWPRIDSLYATDSTERVKKAFEEWYAALDKMERKRYDAEQKAAKKVRAADSISRIKDSIRQHRDSIRDSKLRILETFAIPDSMHLKRLISWRHDRYFNKVILQETDTAFNYHFNDLPFLRNDVGATFLGVAGSAVQTYDFFKRTEEDGASFYTPYEAYSYTAHTLPLYNTKTPYTELEYYGTLFAPQNKQSNNLRIFTTQNLTPEFNFALEYRRFGGEGILQNERTANKTFVASANRLGKKHLLHAGYIYNKVIQNENGGLQDPFWIRDTTVDAREISVFLTDAKNTYKKNTLFLDQTYRIPLNFMKKAVKEDEADSTGSDVTTIFIGHASEYSVYTKHYTDGVRAGDGAGSEFYNGNFFISPDGSNDSLRMTRLENRVFARLQPWSDEAVISKLDVGIGNRIRRFYDFSPDTYLHGTSHRTWISNYIYAGTEGRIKKYVNWDAVGSYTFTGHEANDMMLKAHAGLDVYPFRRDRNSPASLNVYFETSLKEPDFYQQRLYSNHYRWNNDFGKISLSKLQASLDIPRWKLHADVGYSLSANAIWYDTLGVVRQNAGTVSILKLGLEKNFTIGNILHLDNRALIQFSSDENVVPLPKAAFNLRYYLQFNIVSEDIMKMQIGVNALYNTKWYAPAYNPVAGSFMAQNKMQYGACPYFDVFANIQWKRACIFVKLENAGQGWPNAGKDYFSAHNYIHTQRAVKIGIYWPFYTQSRVNATLSGMASGGRSGGGGGSSRAMNSTP